MNHGNGHRRLLACHVAALCVAGCYHASSSGMSVSAAELVGPAAAIEAHAEAIATVWPGYFSVTSPYMLKRQGADALVLTTKQLPAPYVEVSAPRFTRSVRRAYRHPGPRLDERPEFIETSRVGGEQVFVALVQATPFATIDFLAHEGFHEYQRTHFKDASGPPSDLGEELVPIEREATRQIDMERRLLRCALRAGDPAVRVAYVDSFLAARQERLSRWGEPLRRAEDQLERTEGTAYYVGTSITLSALGAPPSVLSDSIDARLGISIASYRSIFGEGARIFRWRLYATGAAQLVLLDRLQVAWRERIEEGAAPSTLLRQARYGARPAAPLPACVG